MKPASHYKLVKEHPGHFEVHNEKDKVTFPIAKMALSPEMHAQVGSLQKFSGESGDPVDSVVKPASITDDPSMQPTLQPWERGGMSSPPVQEASPPSLPPGPMSVSGGMPLSSGPMSVPPSSQPISGEMMSTGAPAAPDAKEEPNPFTGKAYAKEDDLLGRYKEGHAMQNQGVFAAAEAQQKMYKSEAAQLGKNNLSIQQAIEDEAKQKADNIAERAILSKKVADGTIQPNRLWSKMDNGAKIGASIGVILSGMGAATTGQRNLAMDAMENLIKTDVEAQKADLGKNENLLSKNMQRYGDISTATSATVSQLRAASAGIVAQMAARSGDATSMANATALLGKMESDNAISDSSVATGLTKQKVMNAMASGQDVDPRFQPYLDKEDRDRAVVIPTADGKGSKLALAMTPEAATKFRETSTENSLLQNTFNEASNFMKRMASQKGMSPADWSEAKSITASFTTSLNKLESLKRLTNEEVENFQKRAPFLAGMGANWSDLPDTAAQKVAKLEVLQRELNAKIATSYQNELVGAKPPPTQSHADANFSPAQLQNLNFAIKQNPKIPKAELIKLMQKEKLL